jgi:hypothetical protein
VLIRGPSVTLCGVQVARAAAAFRHLARVGALPHELAPIAEELDLAARMWFGGTNREHAEPFLGSFMQHSVSSPLGRGGGDGWVSTREAVALLEQSGFPISPRGLRKSAASRGGRIVCGRWQWPSDIAEREERRANGAV